MINEGDQRANAAIWAQTMTVRPAASKKQDKLCSGL